MYIGLELAEVQSVSTLAPSDVGDAYTSRQHAESATDWLPGAIMEMY